MHRYNRVSVNIEILPCQGIDTHNSDCDFYFISREEKKRTELISEILTI